VKRQQALKGNGSYLFSGITDLFEAIVADSNLVGIEDVKKIQKLSASIPDVEMKDDTVEHLFCQVST
jgi:hypothetical protein